MQNAIEKYLNVKDYKIIDTKCDTYIFKNNTYQVMAWNSLKIACTYDSKSWTQSHHAFQSGVILYHEKLV